jgi:ankyrin repeat protein
LSSNTAERLAELLDRLTARRGDGLPRSLTGAAWNGDLAMVDAYLAQGARLDEEAIGCRSPLAAAVRSGRPEVVARLLAAGASPDSPGAAEGAASKGRTDLLEVLLAAGLRPDSRRAQFAFCDAAINGKATTMQVLMARGVTANAHDVSFAAWQAAQNGHTEVADFLAGRRSGLDGIGDAPDPQAAIVYSRGPARPEDQWTDAQLESAVLAIVASGVTDRDLESHLGRAPLVAAAALGLSTMVEQLAARAPQPLLDQALVASASYGLPSVVESLLAAGADPAGEIGRSSLKNAGGPYRTQIRRLLRRALAERGAPLPPGLRSTGKRRKDVASLRGVRELVKGLLDSNPDWCILAYRKDIETLSPQLARVHGALRVETDVASRGIQHAELGVFVFQLAGHPWTIELRSLGFHHPGPWHVDQQRAATLSLALGCEVLWFHGSDTSGTFSVVRNAAGASVNASEWYLDAKHEDVDELCAELELFLPACAVDYDQTGPQLDLARISPSAVRRLDFLVLKA